jgi:hypothetical protein
MNHRWLIWYIATFVSLPVCCWAAGPQAIGPDVNSLIGIWALTSVNGKAVDQMIITRDGKQHRGSNDDLYFDLKGDTLYFSGNGGMLVVDQVSVEGPQYILKVKYNNKIKNSISTGNVYLHFQNRNQFYITTDLNPPWPVFYFTGPLSIYTFSGTIS